MIILCGLGSLFEIHLLNNVFTEVSRGCSVPATGKEALGS